MFTILSISDSDKHWASAIAEFEKRLGKILTIENIKPAKNGSREQIISKDTETLIQILEKKYSKYHKVLMTKDGKLVTTEDFHALCTQNNHVVFIIGGPYGLDEPQLASLVQNKIAFGKITLPHGLAKLTLAEQIYRSETMKTDKSYHY
ncbi:MAG: 23S rRNA (pseudouridine(1915)-N(3))-methyltransferase RlmH [Candidatus Absconditabacteria bacterium]